MRFSGKNHKEIEEIVGTAKWKLKEAVSPILISQEVNVL
jgi:hypothetical protein